MVWCIAPPSTLGSFVPSGNTRTPPPDNGVLWLDMGVRLGVRGIGGMGDMRCVGKLGDVPGVVWTWGEVENDDTCDPVVLIPPGDNGGMGGSCDSVEDTCTG